MAALWSSHIPSCGDQLRAGSLACAQSAVCRSKERGAATLWDTAIIAPAALRILEMTSLHI
jgi:hypothetical protein